MARRKRIYYNCAVYHVTIRGNNKQKVLASDEDKISFLETLNKFKERFEFKLYGFGLMDNHAHMVIQTNAKANISKIMQAINLSYSQKFRRKYNYFGYVWQGRFNSNLIESGEYIIECLNYIHNNPVRAKIAEHPKDYPWTSYHFYNGNSCALSKFIQVDKFIL